MNLKIKVKLFLIGKCVLLFFSAVYVLTLPVLTYKLHLHDGLNIFGFISQSWVLTIENIGCIVASTLLLYWWFKTYWRLVK
jgi:hypothetical protein